jgi:signal transduction histidine kinase
MQECLAQLPVAPGTWLLVAAALCDDDTSRRRAALADALRYDPGLAAWSCAQRPALLDAADPMMALAQWLDEHGWRQGVAAASAEPAAVRGAAADSDRAAAPAGGEDSPRRKILRRSALLAVAVASVAAGLAAEAEGPEGATARWAYLLALLAWAPSVPGRLSTGDTAEDAPASPDAPGEKRRLSSSGAAENAVPPAGIAAGQQVHSWRYVQDAARLLGIDRPSALGWAQCLTGLAHVDSLRTQAGETRRTETSESLPAQAAGSSSAIEAGAAGCVDELYRPSTRVARAGKLLRRAVQRRRLRGALYDEARRRLAVARQRWRGDGALARHVLVAVARCRQRYSTLAGAEPGGWASDAIPPAVACSSAGAGGQDERLAALAEFAAGAGHEINNPLGVIIGRAQLLLHSESEPARRRDLALIAAQAERIHEMIAGLMLFARPPQPQLETLCAQDLLAQVVRQMQPAAQLRDIRLECDAPDEPLLVLADGVQIAVALRELISNALSAIGRQGCVHATLSRAAALPHDRGVPQSAVAAPSMPEAAHHAPQRDGSGSGEPGAWVVFTVRDDGPGLAPQVVRHAFDPFFSGYAAGRGLGVGLCQVWTIARLHGGVVTLRSGLGQGSEFALHLPLAPAAAQPDAAHSGTTQGDTPCPAMAQPDTTPSHATQRDTKPTRTAPSRALDSSEQGARV